MASTRERIRTELLVIRCRRGDPGAMAELVDRWERPLFYYIRRLVDTEEDAWDLLQDVWLKVIREVRKLREPGAFPTWVYRIARNTAISHLRKKVPARSLTTEEGDLEIPDGNPDEAVKDLEAAEVHRALATLSLPHREVLTLRFLEDFSLAEIAQVTGAPEGTVKSRLFHAKRALREAMETGGARR